MYVMRLKKVEWIGIFKPAEPHNSLYFNLGFFSSSRQLTGWEDQLFAYSVLSGMLNHIVL